MTEQTFQIKLNAYGVLQTDCGGFEQTIEFPPSVSNVEQLVDALVEKFPKLQIHRERMAVAVNDQRSNTQDLIRDGDCISLLPPVGGG